MACEAVQMWSLSGLAAAFLDLAIAYLLLCASAVAYFAAKFLGFFGLNLPCLCDGIFSNIHCKSLCLNRLLVDFPTQKLSHVKRSLKQNFPFHDSITENRNRSVVGDNCVNGILEMEGEASCSSVSDARRPAGVARTEFGAGAEKYDVKGKGVISYRPRSRMRQRQKGGGGHGKYLAVPAHDPPRHEEALGVRNKGENRLIGGSSRMGDNDAEVHCLGYDDKASKTMGVRQRAVNSVDMNRSCDGDVFLKQDTLSIEELQNNQQGVRSFSGDEKNRTRLLERKVEEERVARAALYVELEKERSAAATAADEAMAMILRLQEEKASIEMEARHYQRILEEKSVYDAEEMTILKEIIVRREKEKHFLEKEVEAYRQMFSVGNEQLAGGDPNDDPALILHKHTGSTDKKVTMENKCSDGVVSMDKPTGKFSFTNDSRIKCQYDLSFFKKQGDSEEPSEDMSINSVGNMSPQEKEIISVDNSSQVTSRPPQERKKGGPVEGKELKQIQEQNSGHGLAEKLILASNGTETGDPYCDPSLKLQTKGTCPGFSNSLNRIIEKESHFHDVHVDGIKFCSEANVDKSEQLSTSSSSKVLERNSVPGLETEFDVKRRRSEIAHRLPPIDPRALSLRSEQWHSSVTPLDSEMLKIDSEVGWLRERLKLVQEGREKLSLSVENWESGNMQLKLLEDIARQIQEIRELNEPGKAVRQVSLPLPASKVLSKKRRCRSVSSGIQISSEEG